MSALTLLEKHPSIPYREGGADPSGMDCSGAMVWMLEMARLQPPRTAHGQYEWIKAVGRLTSVPQSVRGPDDPAFATLLPGDLIFWVRDGETVAKELRIYHVHMYLGKEKDGHPVMIGSSDGRGYRGTRKSGFGIVDFHVPTADSPTRIIAFGSPFPEPTKTQ